MELKAIKGGDIHDAVEFHRPANGEYPEDTEYYLKSEAYKVLAEKDAEIRRLRRALYKACANWAKCEELINNRDAYEASEYLPSAEDKFRNRAERWSEMETKCLNKAEEDK